MTIGFNTLPLSSAHQSRGIGYYTRNLLQSLSKIPNLKVQEFAEKSELSQVDLVHYPMFDLFQRSLPIFKKFPTVVTIHDVIPIIFPKYYPTGVRGKINFLIQSLSLKGVRAVVTVSKSAKADIVKYLKIPEEKIYVVYEAPSANFVPTENPSKKVEVIKKYLLPENFVIYVGNVNWNKNLVNMTKACLTAGVHLVLMGKSFESTTDINHPEQKSYKEFLSISHNPLIHILGFVPDEDISTIMSLAKACLLPSYYEGFGLTILEAQACGVAAVTSNTSSMPEVAGSGAIFVNPENYLSISDAVRRIIYDRNLRLDLVQKGFENVKRYSWDKTAQETVAVYSEILNKKPI